jgi:hypothetical protein
VSFRAEHRGPGYRSDEPSERALCGATLDWHFELARGEGDTAPRQRPSPAPDFLAENPASGPTERHHVRVNHLPNGGPAVLASAVLLVASLAPAVGGGLPLAAQDAAGARAESPVPPVELSLDRALELARQNNPDFRVQATQIETADRSSGPRGATSSPP